MVNNKNDNNLVLGEDIILSKNRIMRDKQVI